MTDPQSWPPLCGAAASAGALLVLAGSGKLVRSARGAGATAGTDGRTAVQKLLRLGDGPWRAFEAAAGCAELAVGSLVCAGVGTSIAGALMACQGLVFVVLLTCVIRRRIPGDCGCAGRRRPTAPGKSSVTWWSVGRAACILSAGVATAALGVRPCAALSGPGQLLAWPVALTTLLALEVGDLDLRTPRCRSALLFPLRTMLTEVTTHTLYQAMATSLGAKGERVVCRRVGCLDEFWFPTRPTEDGEQRYLQIKAGRVAPGTLALRATVADRAPHEAVRILSVRQRRGRDSPKRHLTGEREPAR